MEEVVPSTNPKPKVLLFGPPKSGKSKTASTAPGPIRYCNFDLGNATRFLHLTSPKGHIREPKIPDWERGQTPIMDLLGEIAQEATRGDFPTFVLDPVDNLYLKLLEEFSFRSVKPNFDHRIAATVQLERICQHLCKADVNVVLVCHELEVERDSEEGGVLSIPNTGSKSGSLSGFGPRLRGMVDIIGYTGTVIEEGEDKPRYVTQIQVQKGRQVGDRFNALNVDAYLDGNISEWIRMIREYEAGLVSTSTPHPEAKAAEIEASEITQAVANVADKHNRKAA